MTSLEESTQKLLEFRRERDWEQFHNPKDMALSLVLESAEVLEHFQWKKADEVEAYIENKREDIGEELADVLNWLLLISHDLDIDLLQALDKKIEKNAKKYPVEKSKGTAKKYTEI